MTLREWLEQRPAAWPWDVTSIGAFLGYYGTVLTPDEQQKVVEAMVALLPVAPENAPAVVAVVIFALRFLAWVRPK